MSLADRIQARIEALETTARAVSLQVGPNTHLIQSILSGKTQNPRTDTLQKLAKALQTNTEWLLTGRGDPTQLDDPETAEVVSIMPGLDTRRRAELAQYARFLAEQAKRDQK